MTRKKIDTVDLTEELSSAHPGDTQSARKRFVPLGGADKEEETQPAEPIEIPGFEWSLLINDLVIPAAAIEQALWNADVTEPEHVFTKPADVTGAFLRVLREAMGDLKLKVRNMGQ